VRARAAALPLATLIEPPYWRGAARGYRQGPWVPSPAMDDTADTAQVIIWPPLSWGLAVIARLALNWLVPLPFLPADLPAGWLGAMVFVFALALLAWAVVTISRAGSNVPTNRSTTTIVESGPYRFTRTPSTSAGSWV